MKLLPFQYQALVANGPVSKRLLSRGRAYARVPFHGHDVPLIGVPASATEEFCDYCQRGYPLLEITLQDGHFMCAGCRQIVGAFERFTT